MINRAAAAPESTRKPQRDGDFVFMVIPPTSFVVRIVSAVIVVELHKLLELRLLDLQTRQRDVTASMTHC